MLIFVIFEKSCRFFSPSKFDIFFTIFCGSLLNMPRNITIKNQKIHSLDKFLSPKNWENAQQMAVFLP